MKVNIMSGDYTLNRNIFNIETWTGYKQPNNSGIKEQSVRNSSVSYKDEREIVIGLDFGTAYTKVVIGDRGLGKAFAVCFSDQIGFQSYILPSKVYIKDNEYTLHEQQQVVTNLKLNLINHDINTESYYSAVAFLALVIRHARGWLFTEQSVHYQDVYIRWKITLGLPFANYDSKDIVDKYIKSVKFAWLLAGKNIRKISLDLVRNTCCRQELVDQIDHDENIEFDVIPELSAQIYGFIQSTKFDPNGKNIFLMVDVGAGTVDSSIFKVVKDKIWIFNLYSNVVQAHGVFNLHMHRIRKFQEFGIIDENEKKLLMNILDSVTGIPETWQEYFLDLSSHFIMGQLGPDDEFYEKFLRQITNDTLKDALRFFPRSDLPGTPLFLCGGGNRMKFYNKLNDQLRSHRSASWFSFEPQLLEVPEILDAEGVTNTDVDRLSVAFGLSFLDAGKYIKEQLEHTLPFARAPVNPNKCRWCEAIGFCYCP